LSPLHHYVARQPIFDADFEMVGVELLYRDAPDATTADTPVPLDPDEMTVRALSAAEAIGWDRVTGGGDLWVNGHYGLIKGEIPVPYPASRTVVEVLETVEPTLDVIDGMVAHAFGGRRIALDDFVFGQHADRLLDVATAVKLDLTLFGPVAFAHRVLQCKTAHLQVVAEKIETESELDFCRALGCDYFQGYALARPETLSVPGVPAAATCTTISQAGK
jgi:EAL and modified HD-GYP domain-containing signal transduction protein